MSREARINLTLVALNAIAAAALLLVAGRHHFQKAKADLDRSAGLERRVTNLKMDGMPLQDVLLELRRRTGATFVLSPKLATRKVQGFHGMVDNGPGWQTPIWGEFDDVSLDDALNALCRHSRFAAPLHYDVLADGRIFLGADDELPWVVRMYDVRNLTALMPQPETDSIVKADPEGQDGPESQIRTILLATDQERDGIAIGASWRLVDGRLVVVA
ncbi:MAG TPA: hypothetical protein VLJ39_20695, partial [Tepidisphaeraceae bacterium]|nr:hypothetical protein [Tepidisphaeraceae bacterium]